MGNELWWIVALRDPKTNECNEEPIKNYLLLAELFCEWLLWPESLADSSRLILMFWSHSIALCCKLFMRIWFMGKYTLTALTKVSQWHVADGANPSTVINYIINCLWIPYLFYWQDNLISAMKSGLCMWSCQAPTVLSIKCIKKRQSA